MTLNSRIKIIVVTGFLGSGKTTFLNRLINFYGNKKIALIVNDFGKIVVDGALIKNQRTEEFNENIYEIANGSIFCSCLSSEFISTLKQLTSYNPEIVIVETSGLSDPSSFESLLKSNGLNEKFEIQSAICLIDATNVIELSNKIVTIQKQLLSSNIILLNKIDLVDEKRCSEVKEFVVGINSTSQIFNTENAKINLLLLENFQYIANNEKKELCDSNFTKPVSIILDQKNISKKQIVGFFNSIKSKVLRLKGFLDIDGSPYYLSNNNESLSVTKFSDLKNIRYGLSVLLQKENESIVNEKWEKL